MLKRLLRAMLPESAINFYHAVLSRVAAFVYGYPSEKMLVIGVTGTNGKSTTTSFIGQILEHAGHKVGWTSTATFKVAGKEWLNDKKMTMLGRFQLQKLLKEMVDAGCEYAIVETSSLGVTQSRHVGINYDIAVFTKLSPEHIEAHGGFENYKQAKLELFRHLIRQPRKIIGGQQIEKVSVVNGRDPYACEFLAIKTDRKIAYEADPDLELTATGSSFTALGVDMELHVPGAFNVENALAAASVAMVLDVPISVIQDAVAHLHAVPGRLERIDEGQPFTVIVDYAPEPASMEKLYEVTESIPHERIIHVFGSAGGGRDTSRRPILGRLAGTLADICIITNEDPYDEDPKKIIEQVANGAREVGKVDQQNLFLVEDRGQAIRQAINSAKPNDLVLITGKACEQAICVAGGKMIPWDDRLEVKKALHERL